MFIITAANLLIFGKLRKNLATLRSCVHGNNGEATVLKNLPLSTQPEQISNNSTIRDTASSSNRLVRTREREFKQTSITLLAVSLEFLLFSVLRASFLILSIATSVGISKVKLLHEEMQLFYNISIYFNLLNHSANFFLYLIHIPSFRKEFFSFKNSCFKLIR
jgi:hypothetical protein